MSIANNEVQGAQSLETQARVTELPDVFEIGTQPPVTGTLSSACHSAVPSTAGCTVLTRVTPVVSKVTGGVSMAAPRQVVANKPSQSTAIQLPTNFQIPSGTVLIRSGTGQLMLVSQQALARAQAQVQNANSRTPTSTNAATLQICAVQNSGIQLLSNLSNSAVKTAPLTTVSVIPNVQSSSPLQTVSTGSSIAKLTSSMGSGQSTSVSLPTIVRICASSTPQTTVSANQGTSTVVMKAPKAAPTTLTNVYCTSAATVTGSMVIPATSMMSSGTAPITVLPVRASTSVITPITINSSVLASSAKITSSATQNAPSSLTTSAGSTASSSIPSVKMYAPSSAMTCGTCSTGVRLKATNLYITTSAAGTCSSAITSSALQANPIISPVMSGNIVPPLRPMQIISKSSVAANVNSSKAAPSKNTPTLQPASTPEILDNVKKCKNFLATLIKLASSGPQSPTMGQNVKNLVKNLLDSDIEPEEFTTKLYKELKSSPQPYLVPFLKKSLPALRRMLPDSKEFILQCGQQMSQVSTKISNTVSLVKISPASSLQSVKQVCTTTSNIKLKQATPTVSQPLSMPKTVNIKQVVVQPSGGTVKHVTLSQNSALAIQKPGEKRVPLNSLIQASHLPSASVVKQVTLSGNKVITIQASSLTMKECGAPSFREEDDINDVTSMAGVNLSEESACILATNSELVGAVIRSCKDEPFLYTSALQNRILDIGKRHDIMELNSEVTNLVSHATQERLRGLIEKLTVAAQHRSSNFKQSDRYLKYSDVKAQLKFLEQLEDLEKQRKNEEEREMLLRAAKSRSNREDPEQLRLKQKAKEMQQMELDQIQYREANLTALAAIGPRKKRPLESLCLRNDLDEVNAPGSSVFGLSKSLFVPRLIRVSLRDFIFCMEQERETKHSLSLYRAFLK
ncbi:hypothetical protein GDO86_011059 [Hymenochirus boettgeri]|uniref:TAFH domain-containing protein n=1 Tax=Hymenochirus boettgeri TaxID=247094 RepID=A0A8T2JI31_9PIPI|nr:hypothetical protein GDO86_011059 [Hymenochirus boettgeri]KAG8442117.1 hypothetical protein GDO86_011059 [Hymenochirus boettgeri]